MILQLQVLMVLTMVATVMRFASKYFSEPHYISKNGYSQTEKSKVIKNNSANREGLSVAKASKLLVNLSYFPYCGESYAK